VFAPEDAVPKDKRVSPGLRQERPHFRTAIECGYHSFDIELKLSRVKQIRCREEGPIIVVNRSDGCDMLSLHQERYMAKRYSVTDGKLTLTLEEAEEGGYTVTSPMDPEMVTEAESVAEAFLMARDALATLKASRAKLVRTLRKARRELITTGTRV
jgi:antitoxin HicB